ncbi:MAG: hypothetical protein PVS3B3_30740 [Ktedonobacteraceae bacterium]
MSNKKPTYDELRHELDTDMINASNLDGKEEQTFVAESFVAINKAYTDKQVSHDQYVKLINRLAAYKAGKFNDYLDTLAGAAQMGMLDIAVKGTVPQLSPDASQRRRQAVTDLTGVEPIEPEE